MNIYVITEDCCGEFYSVWRTKEGAERETDRLNAAYREQYGRHNYSYEEVELND